MGKKKKDISDFQKLLDAMGSGLDDDDVVIILQEGKGGSIKFGDVYNKHSVALSMLKPGIDAGNRPRMAIIRDARII